MKRIILTAIFALWVPNVASAQILGCYSTDFYTCSPFSITCYSSLSTNQAYYGYTVANLCDRIAEAKSDSDFWYDSAFSYLDQRNKCYLDYDDLAAVRANENAQCNSYYAATVIETAKLNKRIAKMKKVCGSKCKKL